MTRFLLILLFCIGGSSLYAQSYAKTYPYEFAAAKEFYKLNQNRWDSVFHSTGVKPEFAWALVAPEIGHYSIWRDHMETTAVSLFYVEMGAEYNDFSIGNFQIKPSFAERAEELVKTYSLEHYSILNKFGNVEERAIRRERVARLGMINFQLAYLAAFVSIWNTTHPHYNGSERQKLIDMATDYNVGFWKEEGVRKKWAAKKSFPANGKTKFAYWEIAAEYYDSR